MDFLKAILFISTLFIGLSCTVSKTTNQQSSDPREIELTRTSESLENLSDNHPAKVHYRKYGLDDAKFVKTISDSIYWRKISPLDFIDTLAKYHNGFYFIVEVRPPTTWIKKAKELQLLATDTTACASVKFQPREKSPAFERFCESTVGQEANYMLRCLEDGYYPKPETSCSYLNQKQ